MVGRGRAPRQCTAAEAQTRTSGPRANRTCILSLYSLSYRAKHTERHTGAHQKDRPMRKVHMQTTLDPVDAAAALTLLQQAGIHPRSRAEFLELCVYSLAQKARELFNTPSDALEAIVFMEQAGLPIASNERNRAALGRAAFEKERALLMDIEPAVPTLTNKHGYTQPAIPQTHYSGPWGTNKMLSQRERDMFQMLYEKNPEGTKEAYKQFLLNKAEAEIGPSGDGN